jgi:hypothetical protein
MNLSKFVHNVGCCYGKDYQASLERLLLERPHENNWERLLDEAKQQASREPLIPEGTPLKEPPFDSK